MTWSGEPGSGSGEVDEEPYAGPPPTARYAAPPYVPGVWHGPPATPPPGSPTTPGPVPWPLGPVPMPPGPHTHLPGAPPPWAVPGAPPWPVPGPPWAGPGGVPGPPWQLPPAPLPHDVPTPYLSMMRSRTWRWWRPLLGLLLFAVVYAVGAVLIVLAALVAVVTRGSDPLDLQFDDLADPWVLLITNLSLIIAIPCVWLAWAAAHQMRIGSSSSVLARLRPRLLLRYTPLALAALGVGIGLQVLLGFALDDTAVTGPTASFALLLVVVLLTTPLQSAAEEYVFRGYLSQAIAAWVGRERAGALVAGVLSAALFSLAHLPADFWLFLDRFAFGLAASAVVWLTGGLEAAIVLHAVNNVLVFVLAGALGEGVETDAVLEGVVGLVVVTLDVLSMAAYVLLVRRSALRRRPGTVTAAQDLRAPAPAPAPARWPTPYR